MDEQLREIVAVKLNKVGGDGMATKASYAPLVGLMESDPEELPREMKIQLLRRLR